MMAEASAPGLTRLLANQEMELTKRGALPPSGVIRTTARAALRSSFPGRYAAPHNRTLTC
jgi:hypothetical protein